MDFLKQLKEVSVSVCPITLSAIVLGLCFGVFTGPAMLLRFILAAVLVIIGLSFFLLGVDIGLIPVGNHIGGTATRKKNLPLLLLVGFGLGTIITMAEPDLTVLTGQVHGVNPAIGQTFLRFMVAIGVGLFIAVAFLRTILDISLKLSMAICVAVLVAAAALVPEFFVTVAFDSGGATTGPMAVPFIMALGAGVSASKGKKGQDDSFGYTGMASIGPVLAVLIVGAFAKGDIGSIAQSSSSLSLFHYFLESAKEVASALLPITAICILMQLFSMKLPPRRAIRMFMGLFYTFFGLVLFFFAVNSTFMPVASTLGTRIAASSNTVLVLTGVLFGALVVLAEPAIWVLTTQVEEITRGRIRRFVMLGAISIGVASAVALSMVRIITGLSILFFLIPGYVAIVLIMIFTPKLFVGIAFDSGGVATGPMSSTFLLPFATGAASVLAENPAVFSFGMIGLIAMMPVLTIEILGLIYNNALKRAKEG